MKFCKDCRHMVARHTTDLTFARCAAVKALDPISPVTGEQMDLPHYCEFERCFGAKCGPAGVLFEPKRGRK